MEVISLQSGSSGNCLYVESGDARVLIDAGISGRRVDERLQQIGKSTRHLSALVISHDHSDHTRCLGPVHRRFDLPIYITRPTLRHVERHRHPGRLSRVHYFESGESFCIGDVTIESIPTPHDAADGVAFVLDDGERRLGVLTDLGHAFRHLHDVMPTLDAVMIESNYDPGMLIDSRYPDSVKSRIAGKRGHLSNEDAAELLQLASGDLQWAMLAHLSEECNDPELAIRVHRGLLGSGLELRCADRYQASDLMRINVPKIRKSPPSRLQQQQLF